MIKFNRQSKIHPCYLSKEDLKALVSLIRSDFPKSDRVEDFRIRTYSDTLDISENSLDDFLAHKRMLTVLTRLIIEIIGWSDDCEIDKSLEITFYDNYINFNVSGVSESWVNGKYIQVTDFLKKKRPILWFLHAPATYVIRGVIFALIVGGVSYVATWWHMNGFEAINILIPLGIVSIGILDFMISKYKYTQIFLSEKKSFAEKYKNFITIITLAAALVAIVTFVKDFFR